MSIGKILVTLFASLSQALAATIIMTKLKKDLCKKNLFLFLIASWVYFILVSMFIPNEIRFFVFIIVITILINYILNIGNKKSVLYTIIITLLLAISEVIISLFLVLLGFSSVELVNNPFLNMVTNVLVSSLSVLLSITPILKKLFNKLLGFFEKHKKYIYYLYALLITLYLIVSKNGLEFVLRSSYYVNILILIFSIIIITLVRRKELKAEQLQEVNSQMLNYVTKYEKIITEQGKANHEFKNQLMVIKGYAKMNDSKKLIDYLDSITDDAKKTHSSYLISQLNNFPDGGIKGLLYYKLSTMEDMNISYDINVGNGVKRKLSSLETNMYKNITKVLGVLLDNAIEASSKSKNKKVLIITKKSDDKIIFSIYNTYTGKIDLNKIGTGYTTKGKGRGYGLRLVDDIISTNRYFGINRYLEDNYYVTDLTIKIKNKK